MERRDRSERIGCNQYNDSVIPNRAIAVCERRSNINKENLMRCVISVLGKDRSGIVAAVATTLAECKANINDISQTLLDDIFSMTMLVTLDPKETGFNEVQEKLAIIGEELGVQITLQRQDVFDFMYKI